MDLLLIQPRDLRAAYRPGGLLEGDVQWDLPEVPTSVELRLIWYTRGKGTTDVQIVETQTFEAAGQKGGGSFRFVLPDSPYSFSGKLVSLVWALELVVEPGERAQRLDVVVSPTGEEINLYHTPLEPAARS